ncbi:hypothetical protein PPL_00587 [Heterostelium album PN500]|uniref:Uncharacterized protein n=1 Tax=Heterostelium pallidum (strain ATCC 26659 / Pp 5 / PN500) TaxID=670386 RepID=D3AWV9_HETP5|nr:hypothetical protein PPL_00587 [Heterostelium album PN500]EFA86782.1 hypothetical protein PPL_00587 [Heterostelium album PN500]|eukprot:XP_020438886.1 hypothetical protein PPL_00587 [Heterostelium album PN500]
MRVVSYLYGTLYNMCMCKGGEYQVISKDLDRSLLDNNIMINNKILSLFLLFVCCSVVAADALKVAVFNSTATCVTSGATGVCTPFTDATLWNDTNALVNPTQYLFSIDLSKDDTAIDLNVLTPISIGALNIVGGQQTFLNLNASMNVTGDALSVSSVLIQVMNGAQLSASSIQLTDTASLHIGQNSSLKSMVDDIITGDASSSISLYDQSTLLALTIDTLGTISVADSATLFVQTAILDRITVATNATANIGTLTLTNTSNVFSGRLTATTLTINAGLQATFSELGVTNLVLQQGAAITIIGDSNIRYLNTPTIIDSTMITIDNGATLTIGGNNAQNLYNQFVIGGNGAITLAVSNATLYSLTTTQPYVKNQPLFTLQLSGFVVLAAAFDFNGLVLVSPNATLDIQQNLTPTMCLETYGSVFIHKNVTCHQGNMLQGATGQLSLVDTPLLHLFKFYNNGSILALSNAQILGNLESIGSIRIGSANSLNIVGYLDMLSADATLTMDQVMGNSANAALSVLNIITLNGTFSYNVSAPASLTRDYTYKLLSTQLYFESDFHTIIADPALEQFKLEYQKTTKAIQLQFKGKKDNSGENEIYYNLGSYLSARSCLSKQPCMRIEKINEFSFSAVGCPEFQVAPGCKVVYGNEDKDYPYCCPRSLCGEDVLWSEPIRHTIQFSISQAPQPAYLDGLVFIDNYQYSYIYRLVGLSESSIIKNSLFKENQRGGIV